jgi:hypothetical protein
MLDTRLTEDIDVENFRIRFENGVVQAASLVKHFIDEGAEVSLVLGSELGHFGTGLEQLYGCLRRLASIQPAETPGSDAWPRTLMEAAGFSRQQADGNYSILLTAAPQGSIPPQIWRRSYVIYL